MFCIGVVLMLLTTYATLYAAEQSQMSEKIPEPLRVTESDILLKPILNSEIVQLKSPLSKSEEGNCAVKCQLTYSELILLFL